MTIRGPAFRRADGLLVGVGVVGRDQRRSRDSAVSGDVKNSTFSEVFGDAYPDHFWQGYIAEQNMVSVAVGLQARGKVPLRQILPKMSSFSRGMPGVVPGGPTRPWRLCQSRPQHTMIRRRRLFTMLRGALLPGRLGSGTIQTRRPRRYPTPASGWKRDKQGGGRGRLACNWSEIFCKQLLTCKHAQHKLLASV